MLAETNKSPQMSDSTKTLFIPSPEKQSNAQSTSTISNSDDEWTKCADEHQNFNISLDDNKGAKWRATINIKNELAKNLDQSINSYMGSKTVPKLSTKVISEKWSKNLKQICMPNLGFTTLHRKFRSFLCEKTCISGYLLHILVLEKAIRIGNNLLCTFYQLQ